MPQFYEILVQARDQASGTFRKVAQEAESASRRVSRASEQQTGLRGLKQQFGEDSAFGLGAKTLAGAGAVAGISVATRLVGDFSEAVRDGIKAYRAGEKSGMELADEFLKAVPVIGGLFRAGDALVESMLELAGANDEFRASQLRAAQANEQMLRRREERKAEEAADKSFADIEAELDERGSRRGMKPEDMERARLFDQLQRDYEQINRVAEQLKKSDPLNVAGGVIAGELKLKADEDYKNAVAELEFKQKQDRDAKQAELDKKAEGERLKQARDAAKAFGNFAGGLFDGAADGVGWLGKLFGGKGAKSGGVADPTFGLQQSARLTGVQSSGGRVNIPEQQLAEQKRQGGLLEEISNFMEKVADAAKAGGVTFANLKGAQS
jgi:hypothetical protein